MVSLVVFSALLVACAFQDSLAQDGPEGCITASCNSFEEINTLFCHTNPSLFCQCRPTVGDVWVLQVMPCPEPETVFSFRHQVCVRPDLRDDAECEILGDGEKPGENVDDRDDAGCEMVPCVTFQEINTLSCHPNVRMFCQCRPVPTTTEDATPTVWAAVAMPCAKATSFSFFHQTCTRDELWVNTCPA